MVNNDIVTFLESNSNKDEWDTTHKKLIDIILKDKLATLGIDLEYVVYLGVRLTQDNGRTIGEVDIAALSPTGILSLIVAKAVDSYRNLKSVKNEINRKLQEYSEYFIERFGVQSMNNYGACHIRKSGRLIVYSFPFFPYS